MEWKLCSIRAVSLDRQTFFFKIISGMSQSIRNELKLKTEIKPQVVWFTFSHFFNFIIVDATTIRVYLKT